MNILTCVFCLSTDRNLLFIDERPFRFIYALFDDDAQLVKQLQREGRLRACWYCRARTKNLAKFAVSARRSVRTLRAYLSTQNKVLPPSQVTLSITPAEIVDIAPVHPDSRPLPLPTDDDGEGNVVYTLAQQVKDDIKEEVDSSDDCGRGDDCSDVDDPPREKEVIKKETSIELEVNIDRGEVETKNKTEKRKSTKSQALSSFANKNEMPTKKKKVNKKTVKSKAGGRRRAGGARWAAGWAANERAARWYAEERAAEPRAALACALCQRATFADPRELAQHEAAKHHQSAGEFECDLCRYRFESKASLARHMERHCRLYACDACPFESRSRALVRRHCAAHAARAAHAAHAAHACRRCKDSFPTFAQLRAHKASCATYKCDHCDKTFGDKCRYFKHVPVHKEANSKDKLYCQVCDRQFTSPQWFRTHFRTSLKHVSRDSFQHECPHCQLRFSIAQRLKEHVAAKHLNRGLYACDLCPKSFTVNSSLRKHRARVHDIGAVRAPPRDKICDHCGKAFTSNHLLNNHVRLHTGEKPFACQLCPAAFAQNGTLYMHMLSVHKKRLTKHGATDCTDAAPYQCEECGKGFWSSSQQKAHHKLFHLKQSNFICDVCNKMFGSSSHLKDHLAGRHGVLYSDSFKCDTCGKRFNTPSALRVHEKTHLAAAGSVHKCRACDAAFRNPGQLYMHFKLKHLKLKRSDKVSMKNISNPDRELIVNGKPQ